ncbi:MAG: hypothetical protein ABS39_12140 [Acidovorax sp. SCN 65-28]|nr:MAG: hypothetical protein ABS39_12140 [Acidovorax sp. SCN 65-28]
MHGDLGGQHRLVGQVGGLHPQHRVALLVARPHAHLDTPRRHRHIAGHQPHLRAQGVHQHARVQLDFKAQVDGLPQPHLALRRAQGQGFGSLGQQPQQGDDQGVTQHHNHLLPLQLVST